MEPADVIVVGNTSDDPFAIDVAYAMDQPVDIADLISLKNFANSEFCPRFISDEQDFSAIGNHLAGKAVVIVSTSNRLLSRQALAMRSVLIARAAKENGAAEVVLVEPDLYFSAQDRGPRPEFGDADLDRDQADLKKFDGQPFTSKLYAEMLKLAGVDRVVTVHNHSEAVQKLFHDVFEGRFHHLLPFDVFADYLANSNMVETGTEGDGLVLCAPDAGARGFVRELHARLALPGAGCLLLEKQRTGERDVSIRLSGESDCGLQDIAGRDVVLFDDMVRTGSTLMETCRFLKEAGPRRLIFGVTHFYASDEGRQKLADTALDEILTLNTLPTILNRDEQGRLRRKIVVLKIERWLGRTLRQILGLPLGDETSLYHIDMSSKNPRFTRKISSNTQLEDLRAERGGQTPPPPPGT